MDDLHIVVVAIIVDDGDARRRNNNSDDALQAESNRLNVGTWIRKALHATTESIKLNV